MYSTIGQENKRSEGILSLMPSSVRKYMHRINFDGAFEIRLSIGKPIMLYYSDGCFFLSSGAVLTKSRRGALKATRAIIEEALEIATRSSLYTKEESIKQGYITAVGGHRIGIAGSGVFDGGKLSFIKDISTLNYRLATDVIGVADGVADAVLANGDIKNTLVVSPPAFGKTTMLRGIIRKISDAGFRVSVVDERSEIAAMVDGVSTFDLGESVDVLDGVPKAIGMEMALRALSPQVIAADEIGGSDDVKAIKNCILGGVRVVCSAHGKTLEEIKNREGTKECVELFDVFVFLQRDTKTGAFSCSVLRREDL